MQRRPACGGARTCSGARHRVGPDIQRARTCREARSGMLRASLCTALHVHRAGRALAEPIELPTDDVVARGERVTDLDRLGESVT